MVAVACANQSGRLRTSGGGGGVGARCSWTGGRGNLARSCANRSCVFSLKVLVDSINGEWVPNWANLPIKSSHSRIDLLKSSSMATTSRRWRAAAGPLPSVGCFPCEAAPVAPLVQAHVSVAYDLRSVRLLAFGGALQGVALPTGALPAARGADPHEHSP